MQNLARAGAPTLNWGHLELGKSRVQVDGTISYGGGVGVGMCNKIVDWQPFSFAGMLQHFFFSLKGKLSPF